MDRAALTVSVFHHCAKVNHGNLNVGNQARWNHLRDKRDIEQKM